MNAINWFEIPVENMERAVRFYEALVGHALKRENFMDVPHAIFKSSKDDDGVGGALIQQRGRKPGGEGTLVYLHSSDIDGALRRALEVGGSVSQPKTSIGPMGFVAQVKDTEGNLVGLHTPPG
jgi:predicted enzyme related to lactoylglutathione lyase